MKRSNGKPFLRSEGELRTTNRQQYSQMVSKPSNINPVFLEDHYGVVKKVEGVK